MLPAPNGDRKPLEHLRAVQRTDSVWIKHENSREGQTVKRWRWMKWWENEYLPVRRQVTRSENKRHDLFTTLIAADSRGSTSWFLWVVLADTNGRSLVGHWSQRDGHHTLWAHIKRRQVQPVLWSRWRWCDRLRTSVSVCFYCLSLSVNLSNLSILYFVGGFHWGESGQVEPSRAGIAARTPPTYAHAFWECSRRRRHLLNGWDGDVAEMFRFAVEAN